MAATHYLYYIDQDFHLNRVDWPPVKVAGTTVWNNRLTGTTLFFVSDAHPAVGDVTADTVLGGADHGAGIWVAGGYETKWVAWLIDATDLTTILVGPVYFRDLNQLVHGQGAAPDYESVMLLGGTDYKSRAIIGWGYNDTTIPSPPTVCNYFLSGTAAHKEYSSSDALTTVLDSGVIVDTDFDTPGAGCPLANYYPHTQNFCWDRMQGVWTTNDNHKLFVWVIPREDPTYYTNSHTPGNGALYDATPVYYDIHARLDAATSNTVSRIARSPGNVDSALYNAGFLNCSIGFDAATNLLHCYMLMDIPPSGGGGPFAPWTSGRIYHATFLRSGSTFTLQDTWTAMPISQVDGVSVDGKQVYGNVGGLDSQSPVAYFSANAGATWDTINTGLPNFKFFVLAYAVIPEIGGFSGDSPQTAPIRILPALIEEPDRIGMLVNWEDDDDWLSHAVDDVTAQLVGVKIVQVAADPRIEVDTMLVTLKDPTGRYVPGRVESGLYGMVRLNRQVRWNVERNGIKVCRFHGKVKEYSPTFPHKPDVDRVQHMQIRVESPLRELADSKLTLVTPPSGVLVAPDGSGVIADLLSLVPDIIPAETWILEPTNVTPEDGFLTNGMSLQTALEQCAILADAVYYILPHYRDVPSPKFYFHWMPRTTGHAIANHTWSDVAGDISYLTPRFTGDEL